MSCFYCGYPLTTTLYLPEFAYDISACGVCGEGFHGYGLLGDTENDLELDCVIEQCYALDEARKYFYQELDKELQGADYSIEKVEKQ
jgi:hypothetical protein